MSVKIERSTYFKDVLKMPGLSGREYMVGLPDGMPGIDLEKMTLKEIGDAAGWDADSMADGLTYLMEKASAENIFYDYWDEEERRQHPEKRETGLAVFLTGEKSKFIILVAGGGYRMVCSLVESYPYVKRLNEMGYSVFVLKYRTYPYAAMPGPIEDLARAVSYITSHAGQFNVEATNYALCGASAGGHLAAAFGTKSLGYQKYGVEKPSCLFLAYPFISYMDIERTDTVNRMLERAFGERMHDEDLWRQYSIEEQVDEQYPPVFLWQCVGDPVVPSSHSRMMAEALKEKQIPCQYEPVEGNVHGWGVADHTSAQGWLLRAVRFWEQCARDGGGK